MRPPKKELCAFCPATANITGEHLWSDWASRVLGPRKYNLHREMPDGRVLRWATKGLNEKAPVVCGDCNNGWMSDIEGELKPLSQTWSVRVRRKA